MATERQSGVQAMQLSNGLAKSISLWLGHLVFDGFFCVLIATINTAVFATLAGQFHGLGLFVGVSAFPRTRLLIWISVGLYGSVWTSRCPICLQRWPNCEVPPGNLRVGSWISSSYVYCLVFQLFHDLYKLFTYATDCSYILRAIY